MSIASNQLGEIYNQIRESFLRNPLVNITPLQGDPPDKYQVTYHIPGKSHDISGDIIETHEHTIEISIPFGFPHFPPNCKPITDVFHPDFDPGAICIGDFWTQNTTVPELIRHIGEMINGQHYSADDTFNSEAAEWYKEHADHFPITELVWTGSSSTTSSSTEGDAPVLTLELEENEDSGPELTLDLDDEEADFRLNMDDVDDESPIAFLSFGSEEDENDSNRMEMLSAMKESREFIRLKKELDGQEGFSPEFRTLHNEAIRILEEAERLYAEAKKNEEKEKNQEALKLYKKVQDKVSDFPAIQSDIMRMEQTVSLLEEIRAAKKETPPPKPAQKPEPTPPPTPKKRGIKPQVSAPTQSSTTPFRHSANIADSSSLWKKIALGAGAFILLGVILFGLKLYAENNITRAQLLFQSCQRAMDSGSYKEAQNYCTESRKAAQHSYLFYGSEKTQILSESDNILNSTILQDGLAGKVMIDGKQYAVDEAKIIFLIQRKKAAADDAYLGKRFDEAANNYESVLKLSEKNSYLDIAALEEVKTHLNSSLMQQNIQLIEHKKRQENWGDMFVAIKEAEDRLTTLPESDNLAIKTLLQVYTLEANLGQIQAQAQTALSQEQWDQAIALYDQALSIAKQHPDINQSVLKDLREQIARANLYKSLNIANNAFINGQWDTAINEYSKATDLINDPQYSLLDPEQSAQNNNRLKKIILKASIVKEQESIKSLLDNAELKDARNTYQKLLNLIQNSSFSREQEFIRARKNIKTKIAELDHRLYLGTKQDYLKNNYKKLFSRFYTNIKSDNLSSPTISLLKETSSDLLYRMECIENKPGSRPLTLVMKYRFSKQSGNWSLVTQP